MQEQQDQDNAAYVRRVHDKGLKFDMRTMSRRRLLTAFDGAGALALVGGAAACGSSTVKTSQIAIPQDVADAVYATDGYSKSVSNLSQVTLATDNVFGDDSAATELATVTGSVADGYVATLKIAIDPSGEETGGDAPGSDGAPGGTPPSGGPRPASS